jgi:hypothetical protein
VPINDEVANNKGSYLRFAHKRAIVDTQTNGTNTGADPLVSDRRNQATLESA